jgi:hypothetical protein
MRKLFLATVALIAFQVSGAKATLFNWSYSGVFTSGPDLGDAVSGGGQLIASPLGGGQFLVTSISGTADGETISGLTSYAGDDQMISWPGTPQLDFPGLAIETTTGDAFNMYFNGFTSGTPGGDYDCGVAGYCMIGPGVPGTSGLDGPDPYASLTAFSATPTGVPEPSTWALMTLGFAGLGFAGYRSVKSRRTALAAG